MRYRILARLIAGALVLTAMSCREDIYVDLSPEQNAGEASAGAHAWYLLNEGNMGSNRASIDRYDPATATYTRNAYTLANPNAVKELGDVGNDLEVYGSRLYAVINCSHKVEVMRAADCRSLGHVDVPNPRFVSGHGAYVYVSSYVGPVGVDPHAPLGSVYKIDTLSLAIVDRVDVGYQPEQMAVVGDKLYVANSGGYRKPNYDRTVSVIDLNTFKVVKTIDVAINLHHIKLTDSGLLLVQSRGDNGNVPPRLYGIDTATDQVSAVFDVPVTNFAVDGNTVYIIAVARNEIVGTQTISYSTIDLETLQTRGSWITDGTQTQIKMPYGIAVDPATRNIYVTDARNYVSSGRIHCYTPAGTRLWTVTAGDIPAAFAFP